MNKLALLLLAPFALSSPMPAQTFIVDSANGPGTHFLDIPPAIAAVPSGAVLRVRAGSYSGFAIAGKSLAILGDGSATTLVRPSSAVAIGPLAPDQLVVLRDLGFAGGGLLASTLRVTDAQGHVVLDSLQLPSPGLAGSTQAFSIARSADVHLHRGSQNLLPCDLEITDSCVEISNCTFTGRTQPVASATGFAAVRAERSRVAMFASNLTGGTGGTDFSSTFGDGGPAFEAIASTLDLGPGNLCTGGMGGYVPAGLGARTIMRPGGPGLKLVASVTTRYSTTLAGGPGPCVVPGCTVFGPPLSIDGQSTLRQPPGVAPVATLVGQPALNSTVDLVLLAGPQEVALLVFGFTPACVQFQALIDFAGILALPEIPFGPFVTSGAGVARYRLIIPQGWVLDRMVWAQYFTFPGLVLPGLGSNTVSVVVKS